MEDINPVGILSNTEIFKAINDGHIICTPFNKLHVSQASIDITLGHYYYRTDVASENNIYNPFVEGDINKFFKGPFKATTNREWCNKNGIKLFENIPEDHPVIILSPGERILAHSHEFIGIKAPGGCQIKSRSSWARNGIAVCLDAGYVDPGYTNRLTLEIYNMNKNKSVVLPVGERVAQVVFFHTGPVETSYGEGRNYGFSGKYQAGSDIDTIIKTWSPDQMLPKASQDNRVKPPKIIGINYE